MQYEFKRKFEVIDSQQRKRLLPQEIDQLLNEAQLLFVKNIFSRSRQGLSSGQRDLDDIRTLITPDVTAVLNGSTALYPQDQMFFMRAKVDISGTCGTKKTRVFIEQHDDLHDTDVFTKSSYEWEEVNAEIINSGLLLYISDFVVENCYITYIKRPRRIYYAPNSYRLPSGQLLSGIQHCELPDHTHPNIVDLAVDMATISRDGSLPSRQYKNQLNNI